MATVEDVTDVLRDVIDPELGLDFVELGLIYDVEIDGPTVKVTYTLTSPGCPIGPQVSEQIEEFVSELDGVEEVQPVMTFSPPWTPERMSEDAKFALGFCERARPYSGCVAPAQLAAEIDRTDLVLAGKLGQHCLDDSGHVALLVAQIVIQRLECGVHDLKLSGCELEAVGDFVGCDEVVHGGKR